MRLTQSIKTATVGLLAHKSRTALTILGIVIGIAAIMLIASVGSAAENLILGQIESLGTNTVAVVPGKEPTGPTDPAAAESLFSDSIGEKELEALSDKSNVPDVADIMPVVFDIESVSYEGETFRPLILGSSDLVIDIFDLETEEGRFFTEDDINSRAGVAVIGKDVKEELFGQASPIGEKIRVNDRNLRVIGTLPPKGQVLFFNFDETIVVPYTTAQQYIFGIKHFNRLIIQAESEEVVDKVALNTELTLRELHNIDDPENDDFFVETQQGLSDTLGAVTGAITMFLGAVAAIALIVGGIGIMNIMLVSVTERTREIGLRKSVGATKRNILSHFLSESVLLTTVGGIIGISVGALLSFVTSLVLTYFMDINWPFAFPLAAAIVGIIVSSAVGLIFGIYPARKAAQKSPIEALSYE